MKVGGHNQQGFNTGRGRGYRGRGRGFRGRGRGRGEYKPQRPISAQNFAPTCWTCNQKGHLQRDCPSNLTVIYYNCNEPGQKQRVPKSMGTHIAGSNMSSCLKSDPKLIGNPNEADVIVNGVFSHSLLDTRSCVSVVSKSFVEKNLSGIAIQDIGQILRIECADGKELPYMGYVEVDLEIPSGIPGFDPKNSVLLVIPDIPYSDKTPLYLVLMY